MSNLTNKLVKEFNESGPCVIDVDVLEKHWDHRYMLYQCADEFRFIKYYRRGSAVADIKLTISSTQAGVIINRLGLVKTPTGFLASSGTWRKVGQSELDMRSTKKKQ